MKLGFRKITEPIARLWKKVPWVRVTPVELPPAVAEQYEADRKLVMQLAKKRFPGWRQLQYLSGYLSPRERTTMRTLVFVVLICVAFLGTRFYLRHVEYLPRQGGTYTEALVGQPAHVNPVLAQTDVDRDLSRLVYAGLFRLDQNLQLVPDLAERYELSADKKTYTVHLRPNVRWHNGNPLLADDVLFTYDLIQDAEYGSPFASNFRGVTVTRVDDQTITFAIPQPFAPFLVNLTTGILPAHLWNDVSPVNFKLAEYNTKPVGAGPFRFRELVKDKSGTIKSYTLERNPDYYQPAPNLDQITFKLYPDFESAVGAVKNGAASGISYIPKNLRSSLAKTKDLTTRSLRLPQYTALFFNQKVALLKTKELKQALALGVDKNRILAEALSGDGVAIDGPILDGFLGYNRDSKRYTYDAPKAAAALDALGWKVPAEGGLRQKNGAELKFAITTVDQPEYVRTASILQENWEAISVGIELKIMNPQRIDKEVLKPRDYECFLYGEILGADPDPFPFWHSSQGGSGGLNLSNYGNKDVDKLLEEARQMDSTADRAKKYIDFQNIIAEEVPAIFLYAPYYTYGLPEQLHGFTETSITVPADRLAGAAEWYLKQRLGWQ
ncbi:MAG: ABC transporter substrate-binding protein [Patescibacteria group bacterium]